ncbi:MAG: hypothetical protein JXR78_17710 [Victivallales bacterium]|nr:hypothetical protein [Victivallales bacterium]
MPVVITEAGGRHEDTDGEGDGKLASGIATVWGGSDGYGHVHAIYTHDIFMTAPLKYADH